jgi:CubicO group peptidase (beta-lactamase class C family)
VALAIAQLEAEGKIDMYRPVIDNLPEFAGTNLDGIRDVGNVLLNVEKRDGRRCVGHG